MLIFQTFPDHFVLFAKDYNTHFTISPVNNYTYYWNICSITSLDCIDDSVFNKLEWTIRMILMLKQYNNSSPMYTKSICAVFSFIKKTPVTQNIIVSKKC